MKRILIFAAFLLTIVLSNPPSVSAVCTCTEPFGACSCSSTGCNGVQICNGTDSVTGAVCVLSQSCNLPTNTNSCDCSGVKCNGSGQCWNYVNTGTCTAPSQCTGSLGGGTGCHYCQTPLVTPTPVPTAVPLTGSCGGGCGFCEWRGSDGACHGGPQPGGGWCCHRSCVNGTCATVNGPGSDSCSSNGAACALPTPAPGACVEGASCGCSGASAGSCSACGGKWCNGGQCSCGGSAGCSTQLTCSNFTATGPGGTVVRGISQDDRNKGAAVPELIVRPGERIQFWNDIWPGEPYGLRADYNWGDGLACREWLVGRLTRPRAIYYCNNGQQNAAWGNESGLPNVTVAPQPYPWCDENEWDSGDCNCTADGVNQHCTIHGDNGVAFRSYANTGVYTVSARAQTSCVWSDNNTNPCLINIRVQSPPTLPSNLQVVCNPGNTTATFSWTGSTGASRYVLRINKEPAADWANTAAGDQFIETGTTSHTAPITFGQPYAWWSVQPVANGEYYPYTSAATFSGAFTCPLTTPTPIPTMTPVPAQVRGSVFIDVSNNCIRDAGEPASTDASLRLERLFPGGCAPYLQNTAPAADGSYTFNGLSCFDSGGISTYRLRASTSNPSYDLRCGNDMNMVVLGGASIQRDFGLTILRDPWFQAYSGAMHANGTINSEIPPSALNRNLIHSDAIHSPEVASGNSINTNGGNVSAVNWRTSGYAQELHFPVSTQEIIDAMRDKIDRSNYNGSPPNATDAADGIAVYFNRTANITLNGNWQNINFPVVVMVEGTDSTNGNITIPNTIVGQRITLGPRGFLMLVAHSDILVSSSIGEMFNLSTVPNLEGIFIAGRNMNVGGNNDPLTDRRINIAGNVIAGTRVPGTYLSRRTHEDNHLYPADYFMYNPKVILNVPRVLSSPRYEWGERVQ